MKIKCENKEIFYKMYNEMQGVGLKVNRIKNGKRVKIHFYTFYVKILFLISAIIIFFPLIFRIYNSFIKLLVMQVFPILGTIAIFILGIYYIGYYFTKKNLGGEVVLKESGIEDIEKNGLQFFAPWKLVDFVYLGEYGIYFFIKKHLIFFGDFSYQQEVLKYLEKHKIDILIYQNRN